MCYNGGMNATWISDDETIEVTVVMDEYGDYDVRPVGNDDPYANWTVFRSEIERGTVKLVFS